MLWSCKARHNAFHFALSNPDSQSILEFVCPTFYPRITLRSASFHPSADVLGNRVVLLADMLPAMLQCEPKSWRQMFSMGFQWYLQNQTDFCNGPEARWLLSPCLLRQHLKKRFAPTWYKISGVENIIEQTQADFFGIETSAPFWIFILPTAHSNSCNVHICPRVFGQIGRAARPVWIPWNNFN